PLYSSYLLSFLLRHPPRPTLFPTRRSSDLLLLPYMLRLPSHVVPQLLIRPSSFDIYRGIQSQRLIKLGRQRENQRFIPHGESELDRKSTRLNSSHVKISYAVFCLKKKKKIK